MAGRIEPVGGRHHIRCIEDKDLRDVLYTRGQWIKKGIGITRAFIRRSSTMGQLKSYDLVYVFRKAALFGPSIFERIVHHSGKPLVFDFDDAISFDIEALQTAGLAY